MIVLHNLGLPKGGHYNKWSNIYALILLVAMLAAAIISNLVTGTNYARPKPVPDVQKVVLYPGAQLIQDKLFTPQFRSVDPSRIVTFETPDSPEVVLDYYKREMIKEGWNANVKPADDPLSITFTYVFSCGRGCVGAVYMVGITVTRTATNGSSVKMEIFY